MIDTVINWFVANIPPWFWIALIAHGAIMGTVAYLILLERKVASWVQDRIGPNRVGPWLRNHSLPQRQENGRLRPAAC